MREKTLAMLMTDRQHNNTRFDAAAVRANDRRRDQVANHPGGTNDTDSGVPCHRPIDAPLNPTRRDSLIFDPSLYGIVAHQRK
jgi:hypothetical protein